MIEVDGDIGDVSVSAGKIILTFTNLTLFVTYMHAVVIIGLYNKTIVDNNNNSNNNKNNKCAPIFFIAELSSCTTTRNHVQK